MFPFCFRSLLALSISIAVAAFPARQSKAVGAVEGSRSPGVLQFTSGSHLLEFETNAIYVAGSSHALRIQFVDSCTTAPMTAGADDHAKGAAPLSQVSYSNIWDGVGLTYDAPSDGIVRSTYRVAPHADAGAIRLRYNAPIALENDGSLRVAFKTGTIKESAPKAWQERDGKQVAVQVAFAAHEDTELGFVVGEYDRSEPLFIDPTLTWNTFLGGAGTDEAYGLALDAMGNVYVGGYSTATWGAPLQPFAGSVDAFVAKLDSSGNLIWNTFLGGGGVDEIFGLATDATGNIFMTGYSTASWGSPVLPFGGGFATFVAKLDSTGTLIWNTFLGGGFTIGRGVATDVIGNVYLTGNSGGTWGSPIRAFTGGPFDAFAAKLDLNGNLIWNTFLGGSGADYGNSVAADISGNVIVGGNSETGWGSPLQPYAGGIAAFVVKLDSSGTLTWNTFHGGAGNDSVEALALDSGGNIYISGNSATTWGSPVSAHTTGENALAAKLDSSGTLIWNTFLGANATTAEGVAVDGSGNVYLSGFSMKTWGSPTRAFSGSGGDFDVFAAQLDSSGTLTWNTFLGGSSDDSGFKVAVEASGDVYVVGYSAATWGDSPVRAHSGGPYDAFVARVPISSPTPAPTPTSTPIPTPTPTPIPTPTPTPSPTPIPTPPPTFEGSFVIGDGNAVVGNHVTFWGAQWARVNSLSGGQAPSGFKGFASSTSSNPASCGGAWTSQTGTSSAPPSSVPAYITVIVSSSVTQSESTILGNIPQMAIIQTDPSYEPNPGHAGTGTVVAVFCP